MKYFFICLNALFLLASLSQTLPIPFYTDDMDGLYKSGYFKELEKECLIVTDSFISIKSMSSNPAYAWIFLKEIEKRGLTVYACDAESRIVKAPGIMTELYGKGRFFPLSDDVIESFTRLGKYYARVNCVKKAECSPCHSRAREGGLIGSLYFETDYDAHIYNSLERTLIFGVLSVFLSLTLFFLFRWVPARHIKEMFDKH
ncbi:MAG: hypothetical protein FWG13_02040 [Leptospirales bacterium]|nr:hypothetical protein [Leptospirales bacterium]